MCDLLPYRTKSARLLTDFHRLWYIYLPVGVGKYRNKYTHKKLNCSTAPQRTHIFIKRRDESKKQRAECGADKHQSSGERIATAEADASGATHNHQ